MDSFVNAVAGSVAACIDAPADEIAAQLQAPKDTSRGDLALPCFKLANALGRKGKDGALGLAQEIAEKVRGGIVVEAHAEGPFVNFRLDPAQVAKQVLTQVWSDPNYGGSSEGQGQTIVIDFSSPNIAKPFHLGHLRSTVIGWSLRQIFRKLGYEVVGVNHLGDWGTQFGFMIAAWQRWSGEAEQRLAAGEDQMQVFADIYARINSAAKTDPSIRDEARDWFRKLEQGDAEAHRLWTYFVDASKGEFARIYEILGITHESDAGEAFYNDKMDATLKRLEASGLLVEGKTYAETVQEKIDRLEQKLQATQDELTQLQAQQAEKPSKKLEKKLAKAEAQLPKLEQELAAARKALPASDDGRRPKGVDLSADGGGFCMILKQDGSTNYTTRDITAALYRAETYAPAQILYVVGADQRDHFLPWFQVVKQLVPSWTARLEHIGFGRYLGMSTRKGTSVFLAEVLEKARERAREAAEAATKKVEMTDAEKEQVARAIGTGALKFFDLKAERNKDIDLSTEGDERIDWDRLLSLKGETGPYLQFAYARLAGILRKFEGELSADVRFDLLGEPEAQALIKALAEFPHTIHQAAQTYEPSVIARYLIELAQKTHVFVHHHRVLDATPDAAHGDATPAQLRAARVFLVACAKTVIGHALELLGIETLEKM